MSSSDRFIQTSSPSSQSVISPVNSSEVNRCIRSVWYSSLTKGTEPTEELKKEIQNYVKQHTAPYKYPRIVVFRDELPKTVSGKIQRALL